MFAGVCCVVQFTPAVPTPSTDNDVVHVPDAAKGACGRDRSSHCLAVCACFGELASIQLALCAINETANVTATPNNHMA